MRKTSTLNVRIPAKVKRHINEIVKSDVSIKNASDFTNKAVLYYLSQKYNISVEDMPYCINEEGHRMIELFVPKDQQEAMKDLLFEDHATGMKKLEEYKDEFFLYGPEEIIPDKIHDLSPDTEVLIEKKRGRRKEILDQKQDQVEK